MTMREMVGSEAVTLSTLGRERLSVIYLNAGKRILTKREDVNFGTHKSVKFDIPKVLERAIELEADEVIVLHNHPSVKREHMKPSYADIRQALLAKGIFNVHNIAIRFGIIGGQNIGIYGTNIEKPTVIEYTAEGEFNLS